MPSYIANDPEIRAVWPGDTVAVLAQADGNTAVGASRPVALAVSPGSVPNLHASGKFTGAPGNFQIDLQVADVDADANYVTLSGASVVAVNANNSWRIDAINVWARFARVLVVSITNAVKQDVNLGR